jgi:outer membrane protein assembly factor BamB
MTTDVESARGVARGQSSGPRIAREVLDGVGLEEVWFFQPEAESPVVLATLMPDGLVTATEPTAKRGGLLRRTRRESGEDVWAWEIEGAEPLSLEPRVYYYPRASGKTRHELFLSHSDIVYVLDWQHGDVLDKHQLRFPVSSSITATEDLYFVGSDNGRAYGIPKQQHVEDWTYRTEGSITAAPAVGDNRVVFASTDGVVVSFSPAAGYVPGSSWRRQVGAAVVCDPLVYGRWVLVASTDYKLYCLEQTDGSVFWDFLAEAPIETSPVVYSYLPGQEFCYLIGVDRSRGGIQRTLFALRMRDGERLWRREGVRRVVSMGKEILYVLDDPDSGAGRTLSALDVKTGAEKFKIDIGDFSFVPTNTADFGRDRNERGRVYLVARSGTIQVIGEKY